MSEIISTLNNFFVLIPLTIFLICAAFLLISAFTVGFLTVNLFPDQT